MSQAKGAIALAVIGGIIAIVKIIVQNRATKELKLAEAKALEDLTREKAAAQERAARHAKEEADRANAAAEREAERAQKDKLISQLQQANAETLDLLKSELAAQQKTSDRSFELLDRNTRATESLAQTVAIQAQELRTISGQVAALSGGAGCRARP